MTATVETAGALVYILTSKAIDLQFVAIIAFASETSVHCYALVFTG